MSSCKQLLLSPTLIKPILYLMVKENLLCLINDIILYLTSLLFSIKCNSYYSQYSVQLPVMVVFTLIPTVHLIIPST